MLMVRVDAVAARAVLTHTEAPRLKRRSKGSADGDLLASTGDDDTVRLWDGARRARSGSNTEYVGCPGGPGRNLRGPATAWLRRQGGEGPPTRVAGLPAPWGFVLPTAACRHRCPLQRPGLTGHQQPRSTRASESVSSSVLQERTRGMAGALPSKE